MYTWQARLRLGMMEAKMNGQVKRNNYLDENFDRFVGHLEEWLAIPSIRSTVRGCASKTCRSSTQRSSWEALSCKAIKRWRADFTSFVFGTVLISEARLGVIMALKVS